MIYTPSRIPGAWVIDITRIGDARGFFARMFCADEFEQHGLVPTIVQGNVSFNHRRGTLRGMHFQRPPAAETKYIRCLRGAIYDAIIDLRPDSPTYLRSFGAEPTERRVVFAGKVATAAGVSAGIDLALTLLGLSHGPAVAQTVQLALEYDPQPPYDAGAPSKAPDAIRELVTGVMADAEARLMAGT